MTYAVCTWYAQGMHIVCGMMTSRAQSGKAAYRALRGCPLDGLGVYKRGDGVVAGERCYEGHLVLAPRPHHCLHSPLNAPRRCRFPPSRPHEAVEFGRIDALFAQVAMSVAGAEESDGRCACD
jgi:hypothetical protein